jgi:hypothetical protein
MVNIYCVLIFSAQRVVVFFFFFFNLLCIKFKLQELHILDRKETMAVNTFTAVLHTKT